MSITKVIKHDGLNLKVGEWDEYEYLFDLIIAEKKNPNLQWYHPKEDLYDLMKKIAESDIRLLPLRNNLVSLLEEGCDGVN